MFFDAIYDCANPTSVKIIGSIDVFEYNAKDGKVTTWLRRYRMKCSEY